MKIIAMYLPQYHEFELNNQIWGKGFTEWTCVNRATSLYPNHRIKKPHKDIGHYCLLDSNIRKKQAEIAKKYGIYGFCYYHYWFGDAVHMDATLQLMLKDGEPNIPFCFSWANEPWSRRMNGGNGEITQPSNLGGLTEMENHFNYLLPFFLSKNYIKINNKPVFVIYRPSIIPQLQSRLKFFNDKIKEFGFDGVFFVMTIGNFSDDFLSLKNHFDASFDFHPNFMWLRDKKLIHKQTEKTIFYDMSTVYNKILSDKPVHSVHFYGTMVGFDSSPRSPNISNVFIQNTPELFERHLKQIINKSKEEFCFINAWNEWGEGCALEPEEVDGYQYLEAIKKAIDILNYVN